MFFLCIELIFYKFSLRFNTFAIVWKKKIRLPQPELFLEKKLAKNRNTTRLFLLNFIVVAFMWFPIFNSTKKLNSCFKKIKNIFPAMLYYAILCYVICYVICYVLCYVVLSSLFACLLRVNFIEENFMKSTDRHTPVPNPVPICLWLNIYLIILFF